MLNDVQQQLSRYKICYKNGMRVYYCPPINVLQLCDYRGNDIETLTYSGSLRNKLQPEEQREVFLQLLEQLITKILKRGDVIIVTTIMNISSNSSQINRVYQKAITKGVDFTAIDEPVISTDIIKLIAESATPIPSISATRKLIDAAIRMKSEKLAKEQEQAWINGIEKSPTELYVSKQKAQAFELIKKYHEDFGGYMTTSNLIRYARDNFGLEYGESTFRKYVRELNGGKNQ